MMKQIISIFLAVSRLTFFIIRYVIIVTEDISDADTFDINMKRGKPSQMLTTAGNPSSSEQSKKRKSI